MNLLIPPLVLLATMPAGVDIKAAMDSLRAVAVQMAPECDPIVSVRVSYPYADIEVICREKPASAAVSTVPEGPSLPPRGDLP